MAPADSVTGSLRRLGASLFALGRIRLELLSIELREEKERLTALLFWAVFTALLSGFGLVFLALWMTVAFWDTHRLLALGLSCAVFLGLGLFAGLRVRQLLSDPDGPFSASLSELRDDEAGLHRREPP